jgi:hypothetical protein
MLGADSAGVEEYGMNVRGDAKIFTVNDTMIFGICGSFRMRDLLMHHVDIPKYNPNQYDSDREYLVTEVIESIRQVFKDKGLTQTMDDTMEIFGGSFLLGFNKRLYTIENDYQLAEQLFPFHAVGCGADIALGSLYTTEHMPATKRPTPAMRLMMALEASERFSAGVRGPFNFLTLYDKDKNQKGRSG